MRGDMILVNHTYQELNVRRSIGSSTVNVERFSPGGSATGAAPRRAAHVREEPRVPTGSTAILIRNLTIDVLRACYGLVPQAERWHRMVQSGWLNGFA